MRLALLVVVVLAAGCGPPVPFDGLYSGSVGVSGNCSGRSASTVQTMALLLTEHQWEGSTPGWVDAETAGCGVWRFTATTTGSEFRLSSVACPPTAAGETFTLLQGSLQHMDTRARLALSGNSRPTACNIDITGTLSKEP